MNDYDDDPEGPGDYADHEREALKRHGIYEAPEAPPVRLPVSSGRTATYSPICEHCGGLATTLVNYTRRDIGDPEAPALYACGCGHTGRLSDTTDATYDRYGRSNT